MVKGNKTIETLVQHINNKYQFIDIDGNIVGYYEVVPE